MNMPSRHDPVKVLGPRGPMRRGRYARRCTIPAGFAALALCGLAVSPPSIAWAPNSAGAATLGDPSRAESTAVILLGTGNPYPSAKAQGPSTAVVVDGRIFLFDAGPGVVRQMEAAGLPVRGGPVTALFLTHLHSDHTLGYPDLIFTTWVMGRRQPLPVFGPPGTQRLTEHILAAWDEDIHIREEGLEHAAPGGWHTAVHEVTGGIVYDSAGVRIRAIPVEHGSWKWAFAYRVEAPGRSLVISGDTRPSPALEDAARDVDLLVHEVYPAARLAPEPRPGGEDWPRYMRAFHTSDRELGELAARARVRKLVLYHVTGRMGASDEDLMRAVHDAGYTGPVFVGHDLDRF